MNKPELIAPAGNLLKLKTAFAFGADAVYLGLPDFSLRVRINDFTLDTLKEGIDYAHSIGKKAYVTVNIFAHNWHLQKAGDYIEKLKAMKPDGVFISDPGLLSVAKEVWPEASLALSTQANCTNWRSAEFWHRQGFQRIILGRELSLKEVRAIKEKVPTAEIETFVHGALCMAYSGRCFLSKLLEPGRDANLGDCAQPCRWHYRIRPEGHDQELVIGEEEHGSYLLNSNDLCLIRKLPDLVAAGIDAFKIEGRAKSVYYLANVVGAYRRAIDLAVSKSSAKDEFEHLYSELDKKLYHRGYTEGFMFGQGKQAQDLDNSHNDPSWEFCGQVAEADDSGEKPRILVKVHNSLRQDDLVEVVLPGYDIIELKGVDMIDAESGEKITQAHGGGGGRHVWIEVPRPVQKFSVLRRKL